MPTKIYRILRDTKIAREVKLAHGFQCKVICRGSVYQAAWIEWSRCIGDIMCVCPNCHVLLDFEALRLDLQRLDPSLAHIVEQEYINYHNENIFRNRFLFNFGPRG